MNACVFASVFLFALFMLPFPPHHSQFNIANSPSLLLVLFFLCLLYLFFFILNLTFSHAKYQVVTAVVPVQVLSQENSNTFEQIV